MMNSVEHIRRQLKEKQLHRLHAMEPGRKLDVLIATYVMKYVVEKITIDNIEDYWYRKNPIYAVNQQHELERVPNYSTVIFSAFQLLDLYPDWNMTKKDGKYSVQLADQKVPNDEVKSTHIEIIPIYTDLAEAICKSCLQYVIYNNKMIEELIESS
ncbi:hypothetical protein [Longirhabdus pacifica]|uniref:hypothetical protein n=1 Tax=Longirhabdus pacifica TaxID=2305227 RepID=UPI0013E8C355|nr:hypothetical protein [Longirhabdus pacifica]